MIDYDAPWADPRWQRELDAIAPPGGRLTWFRLVWEPGEAWEEVYRWVIYQMIPPKRIPGFIRNWLEGPNPRDMGHYDRIRGRFVSFAPPISRRQWLLFRETGCYGMPYWVVQGTKGGHRYLWDETERRVSMLNGGPSDTPPPGELPYAEPDSRTFRLIAAGDRLKKYKLMMSFLENSGERIAREERDALEHMRRGVWDWMSEQMEDLADPLDHALDQPDAPAIDSKKLDRRLEELEEDYILSGV